MLGRWEGHSITKRSGVYGATIAVADTVALLELDDKGQLIQVCDIWNVRRFKSHSYHPISRESMKTQIL